MVGSASGSVTRAQAKDRFGRALAELRISVTDRCNFRCGYCMPASRPLRFSPRAELLSFEEIARIVHVFVDDFGVRKIRLTGGEPLVRRDLTKLVAALARIEGLADLALTTNGLLLAEAAAPLAAAGLGRVTVSLDALDGATFRRAAGVDADPARVLEGIRAAEQAGLGPIKINCVVERGVNEHSVVELARHFRGTPHVVRFIEYMDVGTLNAWTRTSVVTASEMLSELATLGSLVPLAHGLSDVAERYAWADGRGEIAVIASVSRPFCGGCTRARLSANGRMLTCLFGHAGPSLRDLVRAGASDKEISRAIDSTWRARADRYSEERAARRNDGAPRRLEMYQLGG